MPELFRFNGISIFMNFNDHPPPHFHAVYGEYQITVEIASGDIEGSFPKNRLILVLTWYEQNKKGLMDNWISMKKTGAFTKLPPLE